MAEKSIVGCDVETYRNFFYVGFKRFSDGVRLGFELSDRCPLDIDHLRRVMMRNRIVTFNGMTYDVPIIFYALSGATNEELKLASDRIIKGNVRYWDAEKLLGISVPRLDHIDLMEPNPSVRQSLKTLNGRMHGKKMQDLPYDPDATLTHRQMDEIIGYNGNDLDATELLFTNMAEPMQLREGLQLQYGIDFRSKSDAQCGEAIIKSRVEKLTGERIKRITTPAGTGFPFPLPAWLKFDTPDLMNMGERLAKAQFFVGGDGKVESPSWLRGHEIDIDDMTFAMGIGGLHSTEAGRALHSDAEYALIDFDVASYYPATIINSGMYPKAIGRLFLEVYRRLRDERVIQKRRAKDKSLSAEERQVAQVAAEGLKIALNGCFGKLGSLYSILYAPHQMIATTLGGQLALLMLIERAYLAGYNVVSANTDGIVLRVRRDMFEAIDEKQRVTGGPLKDLIEQWERDTNYELEATEYRSIYNASVNSYIAVKTDGKVKRKGDCGNPRGDKDLRGQLMKNPSMDILSNAVVALITKGIPLEQTIRESRDIRDFVTVVNVRGGATWRGEYLGKVVRYIWSNDGEEILYVTAHATTGNHKRVSKTEGCRPVMDLPDEFPTDIDYGRYIAEARAMLVDIGHTAKPFYVKPPRVTQKNAGAMLDWFIKAAA